jgi:hypothetical protein
MFTGNYKGSVIGTCIGKALGFIIGAGEMRVVTTIEPARQLK